jgi:HSP20 family protein
MTVYVRTPYGRTQQLTRHPRLSSEWKVEERRVHFPVDVKEDDDKFTITAILPGLIPDEIDIQIQDKNVSLKGEFKNTFEEESTYIIRERPSGKFNRTVTLPDMLNASKAEAKMENGVLSLNIPKSDEAKPKSIKITTK